MQSLRAIFVAMLLAFVFCASTARSQTNSPGGVGMGLADENGVIRIGRLMDGGPAATAGVQVGDVLVAVDGQRVESVDDATSRVKGEIGKAVKLTVSRDGNSIDFSIVRASLNPVPPSQNQPVQPNQPAPQIPNPTPAPSQTIPPLNISQPTSSDGAAVIAGKDSSGIHAPNWVKPGLRLTYFGASSLVAPNETQFVKDEHGHWVDAHGQHYGEAANPGGGGTGLMETQILAVHDDVVAYSTRSFTIMPGRLISQPSIGGVAPAAHCGDTWIHPDLLRKQADIDDGTRQIYRGPYKLGDKTYNAFFFSSHTPQAWLYYIYDADSGLLLHSARQSQGGAQIVNGNAQEGNQNLSQTTLVAFRQTDAPWIGSPLAPVLSNAKQLTFDGTYTLNAGIASTVPYRVSIAMHDAASDFIRFTQTGQVMAQGAATPPVPIERATSQAELTPLAIDPAQLAKLHPGQELDADPTTKYTVTVTDINRATGPNGAAVLTESAGGNNPSARFIYDLQNGLLIGIQLTDPGSHSQLALQLRSNP